MKNTFFDPKKNKESSPTSDNAISNSMWRKNYWFEKCWKPTHFQNNFVSSKKKILAPKFSWLEDGIFSQIQCWNAQFSEKRTILQKCFVWLCCVPCMGWRWRHQELIWHEVGCFASIVLVRIQDIYDFLIFFVQLERSREIIRWRAPGKKETGRYWKHFPSTGTTCWNSVLLIFCYMPEFILWLISLAFWLTPERQVVQFLTCTRCYDNLCSDNCPTDSSSSRLN